MSSQQDIDAFDMAYSDGFHKGRKEAISEFKEIINKLGYWDNEGVLLKGLVDKKELISEIEKNSTGDKMNTPNKQAELEKEMHEDYKRFSEFWEKARNVKDEDGDSLLTWDKSNIANYCFTKGIKEGKAQAISEFKEKLKERILDNLETHKRYGKSTIESRMRFNDILKDINKTAQEIRNGLK